MFQINLFSKNRFYIFFLLLVLFFIKFSTTYASSKTFNIVDLEINRPYNNTFDKNKIIEEAFILAFKELVAKITVSEDSNKINTNNLKLIQSLVDSFTIVDEKFIRKKYIANFEVSFNKKEILEFLESKNIFPSIPFKKKLLLMPILVDVNKNEMFLFSENSFYKNWNMQKEKYYLLEYILPNEDLDDINLITKNLDNIEEYNFNKIISKYELNDSIISIIFKNEKDLTILSKVNINNNLVISNQNFKEINIENINNLMEVINSLKIIYENHWKKINQINTSIKLTLNIYLNSKNYKLINGFENFLRSLDLVSNYYIDNFNNNTVHFKIIYNATPDKFIKKTLSNGFNIDTSSNNWKIQ
tara:strand:+ start:3467 stop:4543 length:1077 start_codon:yes stop_codon:yes gene_type:complete